MGVIAYCANLRSLLLAVTTLAESTQDIDFMQQPILIFGVYCI